MDEWTARRMQELEAATPIKRKKSRAIRKGAVVVD